MSDRDREIVSLLRRGYGALNRGDFEAAIELVHSDVEFFPPGGQKPIRGASALRSWMEPDAFEEQRIELLEIKVNGNRALVRQHVWSRGAGSGIEVEDDAWVVWTLDDDGLLIRVESFLPHEEDEALAAAGIQE